MKNQLKSEDGVILVEVIVALIIITVAVVGLYISSHFARVVAVKNYHYRSALFQTVGELERIKMHKTRKSTPPSLSTITIVLDERPDLNLTGSISFGVAEHSDIAVGINVYYEKYEATVMWRESPGLFSASELGQLTRLKLREDYYKRR